MTTTITLLSIGIVIGFVAYGVLAKTFLCNKKVRPNISEKKCLRVGKGKETSVGEEKGKRKKQIEEKKENKKSILKLLEKKDPNPSEMDGQDPNSSLMNWQGKITNNEVEKLLGVSDSTVGRYLDELEEEGKIKQIGKTGHTVYYIKA